MTTYQVRTCACPEVGCEQILTLMPVPGKPLRVRGVCHCSRYPDVSLIEMDALPPEAPFEEKVSVTGTASAAAEPPDKPPTPQRGGSRRKP